MAHRTSLPLTISLILTSIPVHSQVTPSLMHVTRDVVHPQLVEHICKFSTLLTAIAHLIHITCSFTHSVQNECQGRYICHPTEEKMLKAKVCIKCVEFSEHPIVQHSVEIAPHDRPRQSSEGRKPDRKVKSKHG